MACPGDGRCLCQMSEFSYGRFSPCQAGCVPRRCPNFEVCRQAHPAALLDCWRGRCLQCDMQFGQNLVFVERPEDCPICLEPAHRFVQNPQCGHVLCPVCFRLHHKIALPPVDMEQVINIVKNDKEDNNEEEDDDDDDDDAEVGEDRLAPCPLCRRLHVPDYMRKDIK